MKRKINILDKIGSLIPGYKGYSERDSRRNCDKVLRTTIVSRLKNLEKIISSRIDQSIMDKDRELMREFELCRKEFNTLVSEIEYAPYGESSLFSDMQIKEEELMRIYQFDLEMVELSNVLLLEFEAILPKQVDEKTRVLREKLNERNQFISDYK
jgi:hypothetical protein